MLKSFISEVVINSVSMPVIYTDETRQNVITFGNIAFADMKNPSYAKQAINEMIEQNNVIEVELANGKKNYIFYKDSPTLVRLKYYPYVLIFIIFWFLILAYWAFNSFRKLEQNQVWIGLTKETAHQIGTPLSALMAWIDILKTKNIDENIIRNIEKDIQRLEVITERFSKIGSVPALKTVNIVDVINQSILYIRTRISDKVKIEFKPKTNEILVPLNIALFDWVIENLFKNAVDAMEGQGTITIDITEDKNTINIDFSDTGKGIPKSNYKTIFNPGYTTKKRGWGLGLSLSKRIIENFHYGKIIIKNSEIDKGTTFRIMLNKQSKSN